MHPVPKPACHAPWTSLHLDPRGWASVCTANHRDTLGNVAGASLPELWRGEAMASMRGEFVDGRLAPGCEICEWQRSSTGSAAMYARLYDHLDPTVLEDDPGAWPQHLELALSTECNLECVMCNGSFSSAIRRRREGQPVHPSPYGDAFFEQLAPFVDHAREIKFLGGEPFLGRENRRAWELLERSSNRPACHVTTNGTIFNGRIAELLEVVPMSFSVSMDGATAHTVERIRAGARHADILANLDRLQAHAERFGTSVSLTYCLMTENWQELGAFLSFADDRGLSAFVNTVASPSRLSLYHLPPAELADIVDRLDAQAPRRRAGLTRNAQVWDDQLQRLRGAVEHPLLPAERPVPLPGRSSSGGSAAHPDAAADAAEHDLRTWAGPGAAVAGLAVAADGTVTATTGDAMAGVHLERLLGHGIDEVYLWLESSFGHLETTVDRGPMVTATDRTLVFVRPSGRLEVRMISGADAPASGAWWRLAVRPTSGVLDVR